MKKQKNFKLAVNFIIILILIIILSSFAYSDLYLNSKTGYINLNTTGQTRLQITPGGNLNLIGLGNVSIPGNLSVGGNVSIDNSTLFVDAQNNRVGVGTANPQVALDVYTDRVSEYAMTINNDGDSNNRFGLHIQTGQDTISDNNYFLRTSTGNGTAVGFLKANTGVFEVIGQTGFALGLGANGINGNDLFIDTSGNVGIGTTSPDVELDVRGTLRSNVSSGVSAYQIFNSDKNASWWAFYPLTNANMTDLVLYEGTVGSTSDRVTFQKGGNVGIGTASPGYPLEIDTSNSGYTLYVNGTRGGSTQDAIIGIDAGDEPKLVLLNAGNTSWQIMSEASDHSLRIGNDTGESAIKMTILQNGNVGIGTTAPDSLLQIDGTANLLNVTNGASTYLFVEATNGRVGIGTTSPSNLLNVRNDVDGEAVLVGLTNAIDGGTNDVATLQLSLGDGTSRGGLKIKAGKEADFSTGANRDAFASFEVLENDAWSEKMRISSSGNVGIGTASPGRLLDVKGSATNIAVFNSSASNTFVDIVNSGTTGAVLQLEGGGTGASKWLLESGGSGSGIGAGNFQINDNSGGGTRLMIDTNGNVGIGTTAPTKLLHINHSSDPVIRLSGDSDNGINSGTIEFAEGDGQAQFNITHDGSANKLNIVSNGFGNILSMDRDTGNIGIGTTAPEANLDIVNDLRLTSTDSTADISADQTIGSVEFYYNDDSATAPIVGAKIVASTPTSWSGANANFNSDLRFYTTTNLATAATEKMRIDQDGKVGIGTTTPSEVLSINGNVSIEGTNCRDSGGAATCNNFVDIAELFPASEPVESGDIVAIDFDIDGTVKKSSKKYEKAVAGIVSTQPAIVIEGGRIIAMGGSFSQNSTLKPAIALAGRVPVKVTRENGMVKRGDFITTSSKSGIGMKCSDELKCINSIVGIAMQNQKENDDVILVMIKA